MDKQESYGRQNLFVYCKDTCDPRGLYYAKNEVDKVIDDMMAEALTDNSAGNSKQLFTKAVKLDKELKEYGNEE